MTGALAIHLPLAIDAGYADEWLNLLVRWLHVTVAITWIGASFYFVLLDNSLGSPKRREDVSAGVGGEMWSVHGGGFYRSQKYSGAPDPLPVDLHFASPWPAYATWLSGLAMMVIVYYWNASSYLVDRSVADLSPSLAVAISLALLLAGWLVYDLACRWMTGELSLGVVIIGLVCVAAWGCTHLFSTRAAYLQVGAMLGTIMAANVLVVIIPAHKKMVASRRAGATPDPRLGAAGKRRSVHNTYFTLPVLFAMLSNHFPMAYGHDHAWIVLIVIMAIGAWVRHWFILRQHGDVGLTIPVTAAVAVAALAVWLAPAGSGPAPPASAATSRGEELFLSAGCSSCHTLAAAGAKGTVGPNLDQAKPPATLVVQRVTNGSGVMPSFSGKLNQEEIQTLAQWVSGSAGK